jgi:putative hydrolase of the HAD superfamily
MAQVRRRDEPEAVVFDYYGTLTVSTPAATRREGAERVAAKLGVPAEAYFEVLLGSFTERSTGVCGDLRATLQWVAERCGHEPTGVELDAACRERRIIEADYAAMLRPEAVPTLRSLQERGVRVGVVSDCTHELPEVWADLPVAGFVDAVVFSVVAGRRKPHPSLYRQVCAGLDVDLPHALYIGDGGSNELTGARAVGMTAVQLVAVDSAGALVYDAEKAWTGPVIDRLDEVVGRSLLSFSTDTSPTPSPNERPGSVQ